MYQNKRKRILNFSIFSKSLKDMMKRRTEVFERRKICLNLRYQQTHALRAIEWTLTEPHLHNCTCTGQNQQISKVRGGPDGTLYTSSCTLHPHIRLNYGSIMRRLQTLNATIADSDSARTVHCRPNLRSRLLSQRKARQLQRLREQAKRIKGVIISESRDHNEGSAVTSHKLGVDSRVSNSDQEP